ncbi:MarR family winged helix-turn-helix transcriptional regulator [Frateuria aurantia]|uniref:Transcriptional regulator n=1 Tax=Frateuria aurantia (strain ATCC 33424 / DSM 6220 / KCTC 2777 / LMG 1558 / NBRC 3245 / NCIMB 13370) TaxID=767434 RepID=H8L0D8_FRAAD|nr:MarR family transcriptional regulator [Frateuria aurantia]AFC87433.1 transcriptional regulator [Frateuria aurantia DSM 6220]
MNLQSVEQRLALTEARFPAFPRERASVVRLTRVLHKSLHDGANAILRDFGLTNPEYNILAMMFGTPDYAMFPSELGDAIGEKSANITRLANGLVGKGLIEREVDAHDRRKVLLHLTEHGKRSIREILPKVCVLLDRFTETLDAAEIRQFEHLLKKLLAGF